MMRGTDLGVDTREFVDGDGTQWAQTGLEPTAADTRLVQPS